MPRYFFHTNDGYPRQDTEGVDLPADQPVHLAATRLLGELLADRPEAFWESRRLTLTVTDALGQTTLVLDARVLPPRAT